FLDQIADGMTIQVGTVNLLLETHCRPRSAGGAAWESPMASITMRNLLLYTTNECWEVVNLKEAREFSNDKKFIYVFKKLEWENLSIDLLPHPNMFLDANFSKAGYDMKDKHGAKRVFFGGERLVDGISGEANITIQRTELNNPLGLEVQLHITEAVCPALRMRALLRFFTALYICINRGDVNPGVQEAWSTAGRCFVSVLVDHIFFCIKDSEFQLEFLMQSLFFSRASVSDGENAKCLTRIMIGGFFLRDTFSRPPCTLVQPSMLDASTGVSDVPDFGKDFNPIHPIANQRLSSNHSSPLVTLYFLQLLPTPMPPIFASRTVIDCQPLMIHLQEVSCLRIASFLADGLTTDPGSANPDFSVNSLIFKLKGLDINVPLEIEEPEGPSRSLDVPLQSSFAGANLHITNLIFSESPSVKLKSLNIEKDPVCFSLWKSQPIDASQKKLTVEVSSINLSLESCSNSTRGDGSKMDSGSWRCIDVEGIRVEVAMATADGSPLTTIPPPQGVVRVGIACQQYISNTSVEQLFFVLNLYTHFCKVSERISAVGINRDKTEAGYKSFVENSMVEVPGDTSVTLAVEDLQLRFLESSSSDPQGGIPLVCFKGSDLTIRVGHRTLGGAMAISSTLRWEAVEVDCMDSPKLQNTKLDSTAPEISYLEGTEWHRLRAVLWVQNNPVTVPFLDVSMIHVIPYSAQDMECHSLSMSACVAGLRLGGGMNYAESLLRRFGIFGPDGGPGEGLTRGLEYLSDGPLLKLFQASPVWSRDSNGGSFDDGKQSSLLHLGVPDDVDVSVELKDWLFALEGAQEVFDSLYARDSSREERSWHATFRSLKVKAESGSNRFSFGRTKRDGKQQQHPIEMITVGMENLQILKPMAELSNSTPDDETAGSHSQTFEKRPGVNVAADIIVISEGGVGDDAATNWAVENIKFSVNEPIEAVVKRDELQQLCLLAKSEIDSAGRIAAGILRILKLEGSLGPTAITQLSNLGSRSFDGIFFAPENLSRGSSSSPNTFGFSPPSNASWGGVDSTAIASLEETVLDSKMKCAAIATELSCSEES
ncbi:hypothetical protein M569_15088, partial [Genlisea aurea]